MVGKKVVLKVVLWVVTRVDYLAAKMVSSLAVEWDPSTAEKMVEMLVAD